MKQGWTYTRNVFANVTEESYIKMFSIGNVTYSRLKAHSDIPEIAAISEVFDPVYSNYIAEYNKWYSSEGIHIGNTKTLDQLLLNLSNPYIGDWDIIIQGVHHRSSPAYITLLPHGRAPFQVGTKDGIINEVEALGTRLTGDEPLATLKTTVDNYHTDLQKARGIQQGSIGGTKGDSSALEIARLQLANYLMFVYGSLVKIYFADLSKIDAFFDLTNIQKRVQKEYEVTVQANTSKYVFRKTFKDSSHLKIKNTGKGALLVCVCFNKHDSCTAGAVIPPDSEQTIVATALGNIAANKCLVVTNHEETVGECVITLL